MKESNSPLVFWDYCVERRARINNLMAGTCFNHKVEMLIFQSPEKKVTIIICVSMSDMTGVIIEIKKRNFHLREKF